MPAPDRERFYFPLFLFSFAVIVLEIAYTRIFSYKLFYYFTYLIIGLALLGLGSGGVLVATLPALQRLGPRRLIPRCALLAGLAIPLGYLVIAWVQLNTHGLLDRPAEWAKLAGICLALFGQFLLAGIVIAAVFAARPSDINRLYGADLVGAALACALCIPLLRLLTPPGAVMLTALCYLGAALPLMHRRTALVSAPLAAALLVLVGFPAVLPDPIPDMAKTMSPQRLRDGRILFSRWDPVFRIDVVDHRAASADHYIVNHDGTWGSVLTKFDGNLAAMTRFDADTRQYPFRLGHVPRSVLIIGAAGGHEILASLYFGAEQITAVELNPVTVSLLTEHFVDYTGNLPDHPRVTLHHAEGRSFLRGDPQRYDLIWFVAPDSYAAMNAATSGAFVLSESYLYTAQMVEESVRHLTDDGIICMQFGELDFEKRPNRTVRYVTTSREAFRRMAVPDFERHILLATSPSFGTLSTILIGRAPFSAAQVARFREATRAIPESVVRLDGGPPPADGLLGAALRDPARELASYPYEVGAVTDDSPFFWHFTGFRKAVRQAFSARESLLDPAEGAGERVLLALLLCVVVLAAVGLLLPFVAIRRTWQAMPHKGRAAIYFGSIGMGFMLLEIALIQKLTLFLGYPTYSLTVTLFALLLFTGLGSIASARLIARRDRALLALFAATAVLALGYQSGLGFLVTHVGGAALSLRIAIAVALLAPLGLCLGAFMPLGLLTVSRLGPHGAAFVAWAWAINGFASVVSSILAVILSMVVGFQAVLMLAVAFYLVAALALRGLPGSSRASAGPA
jgi:hypothetical protein